MKSKQEFIKIFNSLCHGHSPYSVFRDFAVMSAVSLHNAVMMCDELESLYMDTIKGYKKEELFKFTKLLACVVEGLEVPHDFLGAVYMELGISNARNGQFFTPYPVSKLMAEVLTPKDELINKASNQEFVMLSEPTCGAGGMVIAFAESMQEAKINYQQKLWVQAIDLDSCCAMMTYIQLSLLHIPAEVITGNSLSMEFYRTMKTPAHYMGGWEFKIKRREVERQTKTIMNNLNQKKTDDLAEARCEKKISRQSTVVEQSSFDF